MTQGDGPIWTTKGSFGHCEDCQRDAISFSSVECTDFSHRLSQSSGDISRLSVSFEKRENGCGGSLEVLDGIISDDKDGAESAKSGVVK